MTGGRQGIVTALRQEGDVAYSWTVEGASLARSDRMGWHPRKGTRRIRNEGRGKLDSPHGRGGDKKKKRRGVSVTLVQRKTP